VICDGTDHALEIDGPEGSLPGSFTLTNGNVYGADQELGDMRKTATGALSNIWFTGFTASPADAGEGDFSLSSGSDVTYADGLLTFSGFEITIPAGTDATVAEVFKDFTTADQDAIDIVTTPTVGATLSAFDWTYAKAEGQF